MTRLQNSLVCIVLVVSVSLSYTSARSSTSNTTTLQRRFSARESFIKVSSTPGVLLPEASASANASCSCVCPDINATWSTTNSSTNSTSPPSPDPFSNNPPYPSYANPPSSPYYYPPNSPPPFTTSPPPAPPPPSPNGNATNATNSTNSTTASAQPEFYLIAAALTFPGGCSSLVRTQLALALQQLLAAKLSLADSSIDVSLECEDAAAAAAGGGGGGAVQVAVAPSFVQLQPEYVNQTLLAQNSSMWASALPSSSTNSSSSIALCYSSNQTAQLWLQLLLTANVSYLQQQNSSYSVANYTGMLTKVKQAVALLGSSCLQHVLNSAGPSLDRTLDARGQLALPCPVAMPWSNWSNISSWSNSSQPLPPCPSANSSAPPPPSPPSSSSSSTPAPAFALAAASARSTEQSTTNTTIPPPPPAPPLPPPTTTPPPLPPNTTSTPPPRLPPPAPRFTPLTPPPPPTSNPQPGPPPAPPTPRFTPLTPPPAPNPPPPTSNPQPPPPAPSTVLSPQQPLNCSSRLSCPAALQRVTADLAAMSRFYYNVTFAGSGSASLTEALDPAALVQSTLQAFALQPCDTDFLGAEITALGSADYQAGGYLESSPALASACGKLPAAAAQHYLLLPLAAATLPLMDRFASRPSAWLRAKALLGSLSPQRQTICVAANPCSGDYQMGFNELPLNVSLDGISAVVVADSLAFSRAAKMVRSVVLWNGSTGADVQLQVNGSMRFGGQVVAAAAGQPALLQLQFEGAAAVLVAWQGAAGVANNTKLLVQGAISPRLTLAHNHTLDLSVFGAASATLLHSYSPAAVALRSSSPVDALSVVDCLPLAGPHIEAVLQSMLAHSPPALADWYLAAGSASTGSYNVSNQTLQLNSSGYTWSARLQVQLPRRLRLPDSVFGSFASNLTLMVPSFSLSVDPTLQLSGGSYSGSSQPSVLTVFNYGASFNIIFCNSDADCPDSFACAFNMTLCFNNSSNGTAGGFPPLDLVWSWAGNRSRNSSGDGMDRLSAVEGRIQSVLGSAAAGGRDVDVAALPRLPYGLQYPAVLAGKRRGWAS